MHCISAAQAPYLLRRHCILLHRHCISAAQAIDCGRACRFELELQTSFSGLKLVSIGANSSGSVQFLRFGVAGSSGSLRPVRRSVWPVRRLVWPVRPVSAGSSGSVRPVRPVWPVSTAFPSSVHPVRRSVRCGSISEWLCPLWASPLPFWSGSQTEDI